MTRAVQSYKNHRRYFVLYHMVGMPILLANLVIASLHAVRHSSPFNWWFVVLSVGLIAMAVASRASTLIVQNRLIGLEMRLRLATSLPPELRSRIPELRMRQLIALRFAGDAELPQLVGRVLDGSLTAPDAIKREIKEWRADYLRA